MSDQPATPPDPRAMAPAAARVPWYSAPRARPVLIAAGATILILIVAANFLPAGAPKKEAIRTEPPARADDYQGPKAEQVAMTGPPFLPRSFATPPTAQAQQTTQQPANTPRSMFVSVPNKLAPIPEYMKPKAPVAEPERSGIDFKASRFEGKRAFTLRDPDRTLKPQPVICIMDTMIVTGATGEAPFLCHTEHDLLSASNITLVDAGTSVMGYYKSLVGRNDSRIIAVTASLQTKNNVIVPLGGPVGDELAAAGVPGDVDNHWAQRIGGAFLLALLDAGSSIAQSELSKSGSTSINVGSGGGSFSALSQQLASQTINIPPTITLPQGSRVTFWIRDYTTFEDSYVIERRR